MKNIVLSALILTFAQSAFANLSAAEANSKALSVLIDSAATVKLVGDVRADEKLSTILATVLVRNTNSGVEVKNSCIFISRDSLYECTLDIQLKQPGMPSAETVLAYEVLADANEVPEKLLLPEVRVVRGI